MEVGGREACVVLLLSVSPSVSASVTWGFGLLTYLRGGVCVPARMVLGLGVGLGVGQPPGLPEACQGSLRRRQDGHLGSWKLNAEGLAGRAEATQVCGGSPARPPTRGGAGAARTQELGRRCLRGPPAGRQATALSAVGC